MSVGGTSDPLDSFLLLKIGFWQNPWCAFGCMWMWLHVYVEMFFHCSKWIPFKMQNLNSLIISKNSITMIWQMVEWSCGFMKCVFDMNWVIVPSWQMCWEFLRGQLEHTSSQSSMGLIFWLCLAPQPYPPPVYLCVLLPLFLAFSYYYNY